MQKDKVKKTAVERSLASLVAKGTVRKKEYGKTKLFLLSQKNIELPDEEETKAIEDELKTLTAELQSVTAEVADFRSQEAALRAKLTVDEATKQCEDLEKEMEEKQAKLALLGDPSKLPTKEDKLEVEKEYFRMRMAWKKRKRIVKNIVDQVSEAMNKKPKELAEMIGIETDEEVKVDIADFPEIADPTKAKLSARRPVKRQRVST